MTEVSTTNKILSLSIVIIEIVAFTPLLWDILKTKNVEAFHFYWLFAELLGAILWFIYGYINKLFPDVATGLIGISVFLYIIFLKFYVTQSQKKEVEQKS